MLYTDGLIERRHQDIDTGLTGLTNFSGSPASASTGRRSGSPPNARPVRSYAHAGRAVSSADRCGLPASP
ncbi:hypothetical protein [Streptomyces collinus]|uniref:hypothetical protein n=1 Tax=Streptomyces collinus TaxID=42684 RepID=UPI0036CE1471